MNINKQQFAKQVGQNIAKYRQNLGLTQEQLAEKLDIGNEAVSRIERGVATPSLLRLFEFAMVLHCDVEDLLANHQTSPDEMAIIQKLLQPISQKERDFVINHIRHLVEFFQRK